MARFPTADVRRSTGNAKLASTEVYANKQRMTVIDLRYAAVRAFN
jgi:hypothetical protein